MRRLVFGALALALLGGGSAEAQLFPGSRGPRDNPACVLDKCLNGRAEERADPREGSAGNRPTGSFDYYVLALSWSPGFCDTTAGDRARDQCAEGARLGFVVHGLWPQNSGGGYPSDCDEGSRFLPRSALDRVRGLYPDDGLARHEWRKHGTCTGLSPTSYFDQVRRARGAITIPEELASPEEPRTVAPLDVERAFVRANPGLRADMMAVTCRGGELQEVRICFSKDVRSFLPCPEVDRAACRTRQISILPVH